jgi:tRNA(His) 5'-end guanylyltransferase
VNRHDFELLGDKHKRYEAREDSTIMPGIPVLVRLDGRAFHTFTRGLERPFDKNFTDCMVEATKALVKEMHANVGYTQSDEITLGYLNPDPAVEMMFAGRVQKIVSIHAAYASVRFNKLVEKLLPEKAAFHPIFDARVYAYPNWDLAAESFLWRETDATRNSLAMAAQAHFSQKELEGKGRSAMHEMLFQKGINWNDYPTFFKKGTYVRRGVEARLLTEEELLRIPVDRRPTGPVTRGIMVTTDIPPAERILNLAPVLFNGATPITEQPKE